MSIEKDKIKQMLKWLKRHEERMSILFGTGVIIVIMLGLVWYVKHATNGSKLTPLTNPDLVQPSQVDFPDELLNSPLPSSQSALPPFTSTPLASPTEILTPLPVTTQPINVYVVKPGEGLWQIAERFYGDGRQYLKIYNANQNVMRDPEDIRVGMRLRIP